MTKAQLNEIVLRLLAATPRVIVGARGIDGTCKFCGSPRGVQHSTSCPTWGLIHARIEHHMLSEGPTRPNEIDPDCVMRTMEGGADGQVAPRTHAITQGTASTKRLAF